jgi:hypothetical protein
MHARMEIKFTKKPDGKHLLTVVRTNGSVARGHVVPGFGVDALPHDMIHVLVEKHLSLKRGVYGLINSGVSIDELMDYGKRKVNVNEPELTFSEAATAQIQYSLSGIPAPAEVLSKAEVEAILVEAQKYGEIWKELPVDETLVIPLTHI